MKYNALLLLVAVLLASCGDSGGGASYVLVEKTDEVLLTDLRALVFKPVCSVNGKEKKCGAIFSDFVAEEVHTVFGSPNSGTSWTIYIPGFKDASILSIQVKDENSGEAKPLLSYKQGDIPYMKGNTYVPSAMELRAAIAPTEYKLSGYYDGDEWVERDTVISIRDTLFANKNGLLKFTVQDKVGNKATLEVDFGKVLENNEASTVKSQDVMGFDSETYKDSTYTYYYWVADSGSVSFKPLDVNFEPLKPAPHYVQYPPDTTTVPFLRLIFADQNSYRVYDSLVLNGGANKKPLRIMVVNYAK